MGKGDFRRARTPRERAFCALARSNSPFSRRLNGRLVVNICLVKQ